MIATLNDPAPPALAEFADIIDVRSPAEFAQDHVPRAINLSVLSDAERALVGTIYVQDSRFKARRLGAALVARNIARHLEEGLSDKPGSWAPLIYCWRGGQRSAAMATVLDQVGWRPTLLAGGYRTWRRHVNATLYQSEPGLKVVLLDGYTGSGKTEILIRAAGLGVQVLDLEGLAQHRGSLLGGFADRPQPSQKMFESRLLGRLEALDVDQPVLIEAESSRIGEINLPPALWKPMRAAPVIEVAAPPAARARYLAQTYGDVTADPAALDAALARLPRHHAKALTQIWRDLAAQGAFEELAAALVEHHYDPAYERSRARAERERLGVVEMAELDALSLDRAAAEVAALMAKAQGA